MDRIYLRGNERVVGVESPSAVDSAGGIISKAVFRQWLEARPGIGSLDALLAKVLGKRATSEELERLGDAVVTACRGAFAFPDVDWRASLRSEDARLKSKLATHQKQLLGLVATLQDAPVRLSTLTDWFKERARVQYGGELVLPFPEECVLLELLTFVADGLEAATARVQDDALPHVQQHGCLDYGRPVPPNKSRDRRQMLGFNLVFLFRAATNGEWATEGRMPKRGNPSFEIAGQLVAATLGEAADDVPATYTWMQSMIRSIVRDNPLVSLVPWPVSTDEVGSARWYAPSLYEG